LDEQVLIIILGCAVVTYIPRVAPLVILSRTKLPGFFLRWLAYIPVAVLASLLASVLLFPDGKIAVSGNPYLLAAIPSGLVAVKTRSMVFTILTGMVAMVLLK